MSRLRPELRTTTDDAPCLTYDQAYYRIFQAVSRRRALIHGKLRDNGGCCAVGAYFNESSMAIPSRVTDEVAAYNDSFPKLSPPERWRKVMAWLRHRTAITGRR